MQKVVLVPDEACSRFRIESDGAATTSFMAFCQRFGFNFYTIRGRIKKGAFDAWEVEGMRNVVSMYAQRSVENIYVWFEQLENRQPFLRSLSAIGMCDRTAWGFFTRRDLLPWQMVGMREIVNLFNEQYKD